MEELQRGICETHDAEFLQTLLDDKAGVAANLLPASEIINGLRHPPSEGTCGWYIWAGDELRADDDFFEPIHIKHPIERCPAVLKYLGLAPGWRFLLAKDYEDVWFDPALLELEERGDG